MNLKISHPFTILFLYLIITLLVLNNNFHFKALGSTISQEDEDAQLQAYTATWITHALLTNETLFEANFFYPYLSPLLYGDATLSISLLFFPLYLATGNPILPSNLLAIFTFLAAALAMYALAYYYTKNKAASFLAGLLFAFNSPVMLEIPYSWEALFTFPMPLTVLFFHKFMEGSIKYSILFFFSFLFILLEDWYYALFILIIIVFLILYYLYKEGLRKKLFKNWRSLFFILLITGLIVFAYGFPFYMKHKKENLSFTIEDATFFSSTALGYVLPPPWTLLGSSLKQYAPTLYNQRFYTFIGFLPLFFFFYSLKQRKAIKNLFYPYYLFLFLLFFLFSLGPLLRLVDAATHFKLPYYFLAPYIPFLRVTSRFSIAAMLPLSILIAFSLRTFFIRMKSLKYSRLVLLGAIVSLGIFSLLEHFYFIPQLPAPFQIADVYTWLKEQEGDFPIVELPIHNPTDPHFEREAGYMLASTVHWKKIVNGASSFFPNGRTQFVEKIKSFPDRASLCELARINVKYILFHQGFYPSNETLRKTLAEERLILIQRFNQDYVFALRTNIQCSING